MKPNRICLASSVAAVLLAAGPAFAAVEVAPDSSLTPIQDLYTSDFGNIVVTTGGGHTANVGAPDGRNDDGFSGPFDFGFTLTNFFGHDYNQFWVNNNGNVTLTAGSSQYYPYPPAVMGLPYIAPFLADVDTTGEGSGVVYLNQSRPNETIVTWDHVGYYPGHDDRLDTFQLVIRGPEYAVPAGEGQIGFFWTTMQWEANYDTATPAAVGLGDGSGLNALMLESSMQPGVAGVVDHKSMWVDLNALAVPTEPPPPPPPPPAIPEPETYALLMAGLAVLGAAMRRRRRAD